MLKYETMRRSPIYIIGAGAIGKALAVFLKLEGKDVVLIHGRSEAGARSIDTIKVELPDDPPVEARIETATVSDFQKLSGLIVFANKAFGNAHLAEAVRGKAEGSPILIMQNGLGVEQAFVEAGFEAIYRCVLFATSQVLSPTMLRFKPVAPSAIGAVKGSGEGAAVIAGQVDNVYFPFRAEAAIEQVVWRKTIVNCAFNSVCPLLETDNGIFHRNETAVQIARGIIREGVGIARAKGVLLDEEDVVQTLLAISRSSEGQLISTYVDILNQRETEIDSLNFAIVGMAEGIQQQEAVKATRLLGELTRLKSELSRMIRS